MAEPLSFPEPEDVRSGAAPDKYAGMDIIDSSADVDPEDRPRPISAAALASTESKSFLYNCHQTSIKRGEKVTVVAKIVNLTDRSLFGSYPVEVRDLVQKLFFSAEPQGAKKDPPKIRMEKQLKRLEELGHAYGVAGFVEPKFCLRQQDEDAERGVVWIGRIELHDLTEFSRICEGDEALAARRLEPFSE